MIIKQLLDKKEVNKYFNIILDLQKNFYDVEYNIDIIELKMFCFRNKIKEKDLINEVIKELKVGK